MPGWSGLLKEIIEIEDAQIELCKDPTYRVKCGKCQEFKVLSCPYQKETKK